jgi:hypothetical protein
VRWWGPGLARSRVKQHCLKFSCHLSISERRQSRLKGGKILNMALQVRTRRRSTRRSIAPCLISVLKLCTGSLKIEKGSRFSGDCIFPFKYFCARPSVPPHGPPAFPCCLGKAAAGRRNPYREFDTRLYTFPANPNRTPREHLFARLVYNCRRHSRHYSRDFNGSKRSESCIKVKLSTWPGLFSSKSAKRP